MCDYLAEIVVIYAKLTWSFLVFCDITYGCSLIVRFLKNQKPRLRFDLFGLNENHKSYHNSPLWNHSKHANKRCCLYLFTRIRQTSYLKAETRLSKPKTVGESTEKPRKVWTNTKEDWGHVRLNGSKRNSISNEVQSSKDW